VDEPKGAKMSTQAQRKFPFRKFTVVVTDPSGAAVEGYNVRLYQAGTPYALRGITREDGSAKMERATPPTAPAR
jgi:hypothetical protein